MVELMYGLVQYNYKIMISVIHGMFTGKMLADNNKTDIFLDMLEFYIMAISMVI